ncbi:MAG: biopolymer transporter ExbD [Gammaproteobacteria bacterium]|nr:MAG: biopolymer transporter ExbD [Gammaproteobacteria bacterium]
MRINPVEEDQPEIGLIALIDCIFFLLMFFMVATSFKQQADIHQQNTLPVVLPEAHASLNSGLSAPKAKEVGIDKKGNLFLDGESITLHKLQEKLKDAGSDSRQTLIEISGDEAVAYKYIVSVVDICQFEGFTNIVLNTRAK